MANRALKGLPSIVKILKYLESIGQLKEPAIKLQGIIVGHHTFTMQNSNVFFFH